MLGVRSLDGKQHHRDRLWHSWRLASVMLPKLGCLAEKLPRSCPRDGIELGREQHARCCSKWTNRWNVILLTVLVLRIIKVWMKRRGLDGASRTGLQWINKSGSRRAGEQHRTLRGWRTTGQLGGNRAVAVSCRTEVSSEVGERRESEMETADGKKGKQNKSCGAIGRNKKAWLPEARREHWMQ
jgi:hypothetical protein